MAHVPSHHDHKLGEVDRHPRPGGPCGQWNKPGAGQSGTGLLPSLAPLNSFPFAVERVGKATSAAEQNAG